MVLNILINMTDVLANMPIIHPGRSWILDQFMTLFALFLVSTISESLCSC